MSNKAAFLDIKGIKCDNEACDYSEMEAEFIPDKYLNMPCPKCESNLFTQADYDVIKAQMKLVEALNDMFPNAATDNDKYFTAEIKLNGSGKMGFGDFGLKTRKVETNKP